jgi:H+-translocating NAD(P) transhydrogenase subunit alpha
MTSLTVGFLRETTNGERRVALDPASVTLLCAAGRTVLLEAGAGAAASYPDSMYIDAGAEIVDRDEVVTRSSVVAVVRPPDARLLAELRDGQTLIGLLDPFNHLENVQKLADRGVVVIAFEMLPRR